MTKRSSRRAFLASGLALPSAASATLASAQSAPKAGSVPVRALGKTGVKVSRLGLGGNAISDPTVVLRAIDMGVTFIDTARSYANGNHERMIGGVIKGRRKDVVVQTKSTATGRDAMLKDLEASLRELGTDYVDIWHLHGRNTPGEVNDGMFEAQRLAKEQGKIRLSGVSMHFTMKEMIPYLVKLGQTDVILTAYNFSMPPDMEMEKTLSLAHSAGIGIVAMKVMAGGFARIQRGDRLYTDNPKALTERLKQPGAMVSSMKWVARNQDVDVAVIGMTDAEQVEENVALFTAPYTDSDRKLLARQLDYISPLYCRMCGACAGQCAQNLPVGDMLRILSYADGYRQFPMARENFLQLPASARGARCTDCDACAVHCPHGVQVRDRISLAHHMLA
jgi:hypothetical protein